VTEPVDERRKAPEAARNGSRASAKFLSAMRVWGVRAGPVGLIVAALGSVGGILMIVTEFTTLYSVKVLTASCDELASPDLRGTCVTSGGDHHSYALLLIGLLAVLMAIAAGFGRSRPAAAALIAIGVIVIVIFFLVIDLPDSGKTGAIGENFDQARSVKGPGLWLELAGGLAAIGAGALRLAVGKRGPPARARPRGKPPGKDVAPARRRAERPSERAKPSERQRPSERAKPADREPAEEKPSPAGAAERERRRARAAERDRKRQEAAKAKPKPKPKPREDAE
jgi:hypothetical protein